jgi:D-xylose transport system permease protein
MVGQIDLSVGSMSGFASAMVGMLWVNHGWPVLLAIVAAIVVGALVGAIYALLLTRLGMPSFVATLAGLLAILGMQLYVLGATGSINLPYDSTLVNLGQLIIIPAAVSYLLALAPGAVMMLLGMRTRERRRASNLSAPSVGSLLVRSLAITVLLEVVVAYLNQGRGVPLMFGVFLGLAVAMDYALKRTRWGRSMNAVGGNHEAARRAGINVSAIYTSAFVLCASFAALGGVLTAARLASASQQAGSGDVNLNAIAAAVIGGTSLFGGRGSAYSAVLGIIVIQSIASGLTLLNLSSSLRFMITGAVLAIAVIVDSLARQSRVSHGRA